MLCYALFILAVADGPMTSPLAMHPQPLATPHTTMLIAPARLIPWTRFDMYPEAG